MHLVPNQVEKGLDLKTWEPNVFSIKIRSYCSDILLCHFISSGPQTQALLKNSGMF